MMNIIHKIDDDEYNPDRQASRESRMGHSQKDKKDNHDKIVRVASQRFRELGVNGIGVADLMKDAGLTHGGFYRHFASREDLVDEAVARALHDGAKGAVDAIEHSKLGKPALFAALVDWYLSTAHRDDLANSCAVTSMAADVARSRKEARDAYTDQVNVYIELFSALLPADRDLPSRAKAIRVWTILVGAVSMARAVNDNALSLEILSTAALEAKSFLK